MRSIDYFDRGVGIDPDRIAMRDSNRALSFAEAQAMTKRIAVAMFEAGFAQQQPAALYSPNSVDVLLTLLGMWRANAKWIPVNTRNAIDANAAYLNYVRCEWLFYHSSLAGDVAELRARVPGLSPGRAGGATRAPAEWLAVAAHPQLAAPAALRARPTTGSGSTFRSRKRSPWRRARTCSLC